ncbi:MAG: hypothetical protein JWP36_1128 [Paucimonas sp.]|nr:hypothetical protein [Paucimonas sp.]
MGLFALTNIPGARILRFPLTEELNVEVSAAFSAQYQAFISGIVDLVPFDGRYRPEEGELLVIENFEDLDGLAGAVANPISVDQFNPAVHPLEMVKALFSGSDDGSSKILIQLFERRRLFATKALAMYFSGNTFARLHDSGLTLDTKLLAVLEGKRLQFQSFHFLGRVFEVGEYFNEATEEEVKSFASHASFQIADASLFSAAASSLVRKKIALILQSGILDKFTATQLAAAAQTFKVNLKTTEDGNKIVLPQGGAELRSLLRFLDEDYYESPLTQTHFISNSKRVAD